MYYKYGYEYVIYVDPLRENIAYHVFPEIYLDCLSGMSLSLSPSSSESIYSSWQPTLQNLGIFPL
jgi:hypothetical protein